MQSAYIKTFGTMSYRRFARAAAGQRPMVIPRDAWRGLWWQATAW